METEEQIKVLSGKIVKTLLQQIEKYQRLMEIDRNLMKIGEDLSGLEEQMSARNDIYSQLTGMANLVETSQQELARLLNITDKTWEAILSNIKENSSLKETLVAMELHIKKVITTEEKVVAYLEGIKIKNYQELKIIKQYKELETAYLDRPEKYPPSNVFDVQK